LIWSVPGNFVGVYINPKLHQPLENGSYSTVLASNNTPSTDNPSSDSDATPQVFQEVDRQRREINDLILRDAQFGANQTNTTQDFNDAANATPFTLIAAIFKALFNIDMDLSPATAASTVEQPLVEPTPESFVAPSNENTANTVTTIGI